MLTKRRYFNKMTGKYDHHKDLDEKGLPTTSEEKLKKVKEYMIIEQKKEKRKMMMILGFIFVIVAGFIYWLLFMNYQYGFWNY